MAGIFTEYITSEKYILCNDDNMFCSHDNEMSFHQKVNYQRKSISERNRGWKKQIMKDHE